MVKPGTFVAGKSGNTRGRPPSKELTIREQQMQLDSAIRRAIPQEKVIEMVRVIMDKAIDGDTKAAQSLLPYFLTKPSSEDVKATDSPRIVIKVENATVFAEAERKKLGVVVDSEFTKVEQ